MKIKMSKRFILAAVIGFVAGALWLVAVRFITYSPDIVHYHANFALYVNGERENFDNFTFYEEVASCGSDEDNNPKTRVHMHDNVSDVVHVHDAGSTWGHFFSNLGFSLSNSVLQTESGIYIDDADGGKRLRFILNGQESRSIANQTIRSEDTLLITYGDESPETLRERYEAIERSAGEYNQKSDPASCKGSEDLSFGKRLKKAIGINE